MIKYIVLLFSALVLPLHADLAWVDIDDPAGSTSTFYSSLAGSDGAEVTSNGVTSTLFGTGLGSRDRALSDAMLSDFVFRDGSDVTVGIRLAGLPAGTYDVESWHYDGAGHAGAIQVEFREVGGSATVLVDQFSFSTTAASYQITADGTKTYELIFREDDGNNRCRFNGLKIRVAGSTPSLPVIFLDANDTNTVASGGSPDPFWSTSSTTGNLWKKRPGYGFDVNGNTEIYEKDTAGNVGNAALLETTITGLVPAQEYGVYTCFISPSAENWRVRAGFSSGELIEFRPSSPFGKITDLGLSSVQGSNRNQYLGFVGNVTADPSGNIVVYIDDGVGSGSSTRSWYEGVAVGDPVVIPIPPALPDGAVEIAPDGAWTWFNDERAIFHQGYLFSGYVMSDGRYGVTRYDPATSTASHAVISTASSEQTDDHNNPSLTILPDGRLLAIYSKHSGGARFYYRTSKVPLPAADSDWNDEQIHSFDSSGSGNSYSNTYRLSGESNLIYNFHRNINFNPCLSTSTDNGATWSAPTHFIDTGTGNTRPYPRYCSNHTDRVDLIYTDGHPRNSNNSIYHLYYQAGHFRATDGTSIKALADIPLDHDGDHPTSGGVPERGSVVYQYSSAVWGASDGPDDWIPSGRGWTWDICYGTSGAPVCVFQVQKDNVTGSGWANDRIYYYYARWTGTEWQRRFIAQAGRGLYSKEDDYGGGMTIDPEDPRVVYISTNAANPFNLTDIVNVPLAANDRYEIWRGFTADGGLTFTWTPVTENSEADNLRPIVPENHGKTRHLLWFFGNYVGYTNYNTRVVGIFDSEKQTLSDWQTGFGLSGTDPTTDSDLDGLDDLLEYALVTSPIDPADHARPFIDSSGYSFRYDATRTDIEWIVETSVDLLSWTEVATIRAGGLPHDIATGYTLETDGGSPETLKLSRPIPSSEPRRFMRLRVVERP